MSVTTVREIKILKSLRHVNVVPLLSMVVRKGMRLEGHSDFR